MFSKKIKYKGLILFLIFVFFVSTGLRCKLTEPSVEDIPRQTLNIWGVWETQKQLNKIIKDFQLKHPNVTVRYRQFRYQEYEQQILKARANRQEPDIVFLHNTWMGEYLDALEPMPASVKVPTAYVEGTIKKEQVIRIADQSTPSLKSVNDTYLSVVYKDVVRPDENGNPRVYGLPLYVDTLVLFYNKDILDNSGILETPNTWSEFQDYVKLMTRQDTEGNLIQSGAALGTAGNMERYFDILSLLMMQSGSEMVSGNKVMFDEIQKGRVSYGSEALRFYTSFALPDRDVYSWNDKMTNSINEFALGKVGFAFGYSYHLDRIRTLNPKLNFAVARVPQITTEREVNYANYWLPTVMKTSGNKDLAWSFITYATSPKVVDSFLDASNRPPAIRAYLKRYEEDFDLEPFISQSLTARSWYRGKGANTAEGAFKKMIDKVIAEPTPSVLQEAVLFGASEVNKAYR